MNKKPVEDVKVDIPFGEYANPSFESQIETLAKARPGSAIMSIEAQVEELYGDSKEPKWKAEEVRRLKKEAGIEAEEEPSVAGLDGIQQVQQSAAGDPTKDPEEDPIPEPRKKQEPAKAGE